MSFGTFPPTADTLARRELNEAKRELLKAQTGLDYATAMVAYHTTRIARLEALTSKVAAIHTTEAMPPKKP